MWRQANHTTQDEADYDTFQDAKEKYYNPPEESNLTSFEEDNYSEHQKHWMSNIRWVNCSTTSSIDLGGYKHALLFFINLNTKVKWNLVAYGCAGTSVAAIGDGFVKVSRN